MRGLDLLRAAIDPGPPVDPLDELAAVAKRFTPQVDVTKRRTDDTERVALDELQVDPDYQRPPDREKIQAFVDHVKAGGAIPRIKVNQRPDGTRWITDGQHRAAAAAICGHTHIDAKITHKPSQDEPQETNLIAKVADDDDLAAIALLRGHGARIQGKRLVLELGAAGRVSYTPHQGEYVAKTERGSLQVEGMVERIADRLELGGLSLESAGLRPVSADDDA